MRSTCFDLGIMMRPSCVCQRSTTCAGVTSCAFAAATTGSDSMSFPWPSGLYASTATPFAAQNARFPGWLNRGWTSIWFTAGVSPESSISARRCCGRKLLTPGTRTAPSSRSFSSARHVSLKNPAAANGQWIRYMSTTSTPRLLRERSNATIVESYPWSQLRSLVVTHTLPAMPVAFSASPTSFSL